MKSVILLLVIGSALLLRADDDERSPLAGHSTHGNAFNEGPRQAAYLMEGMPDIDFPVTTKNDLAQKFFNQGVGQLHGFWYFESERSFRQVAMLDTNCVMAFWGMAMANVNNGKRAKEFMTNAVTRTNGLSRRECLYIDSLARFYDVGKKEEKKETSSNSNSSTNRPSGSSGNDADVERHRRYIKNLEQIIEEFPDDIEAKALLAFKIWDNGGRIKISSHIATDALAKQVLAVKPMHPVHHQLIHLWNGEADRRATNAAAHCGQGSPGIAHMWHMPGHTYSSLHRYHDASWQQEASARVDHAHMIRDRVLPDQIHNYAHNNEWLVKNLNYLGRIDDALSLSKNLIELPRHPKYNLLSRPRPTTNSLTTTNAPNYAGRNNSANYGRGRLIETLIKWELWDEAIKLAPTMYLEPTDVPEEQARRGRALGIAYFESRQAEKGKAEIAAIEAAIKEQKSIRQAEMDAAEAKARKEKKSDELITKAMTDVINAHNPKLKAIELALSEVKVFQMLASNDSDGVKKELETMKDLPKERLASFHLRLGDNEKALKVAKEALSGASNQVQVMATYVEALAKNDKKEELTNAFTVLRQMAAQADLKAPIFQRLGSVAKSLGHPQDWRAPYLEAKDVGHRPSLDTLGPFRWHPSPAPTFALRDAQKKKVSLSDYKGKPVLVIFYLGYGCVHCLEQLNAFAPTAEEFKKAGIDILAISTDSPDGLYKTFEKSSSGKGFPFPIVSDESLDSFRAYRAYDDFEKMPLHGTFLVDGAGLIRWQDISFEPFTDAEFLLKESKRLLNLSAPAMLSQRAKFPAGRNSRL